MSTFEQDLRLLLNKHSVESGSNTPDSVLAAFLQASLAPLNEAIVARDTWYHGSVCSPGSNAVRPGATIGALCHRAYATAKAHGFHPDDQHASGGIPGAIALIHSELSEALEADRKDDRTNFGEELADVAIRLFDLARCENIDLEGEILAKMDKNDRREFKHGGKKY